MRLSLKSITPLVFLAAGASAQIKVMPFGDSITEWGCWRAKLWTKLQDAGYKNIDFIGSMAGTQNCNVQYDVNNEGHAGYLAINIANQNQLVGWLANNKLDVILMHLGTNDIFGNRSTNDILVAFDKLVDQMRVNNPNMKIIVAQIIPSSLNSNGMVQLNAAIPAWAQRRTLPNSPITVVDQYTGYSGTGDNGDGIHPNTSGDTKIADKWYPALKAALDGLQGGGPTTTTVVPTSTTTTVIPTVPTTTVVPTPTPTGPAAGPWAQCGGTNWGGPTACQSGYTCKVVNEWYSQCQP